MRRQYISGMGCAMVLALALQGCNPDSKPPTPPQVLKVGVIKTVAESVEMTHELSGRTVASQTSQVRPRVGGIVTAQLFQEGRRVQAGDALYQIDATLFKAAADEATANVALASASVESTRLRAERYEQLAQVEGISQQDLDDARSTYEQAKATVAANQAALATARANLLYTRVTAPISGRIGRSGITRGALVTESQEAELATIQQLDPMHVDLTQSSEEYLAMRKQLLAVGDASKIAVRLQTSDGTYYSTPGTLAFSDIAVDASTDSVILRAAFANPDDAILPGMYVRAQIILGVDDKALLVPQGAVTRKANGEPQLWIARDGVAEQRTIKLGATLGNRWQVTSGLSAGENVIVDNLQGLSPGLAVDAIAIP